MDAQLAQVRRERALAFEKTQKEEKWKKAVERATLVVVDGLNKQAVWATCPLFSWMSPETIERAVLWAGPLIIATIRKRFLFSTHRDLFSFINSMGHVVEADMDRLDVSFLVRPLDQWRFANRMKKRDALRNIIVLDDARTLLVRHSEGIYAENQPSSSLEDRLVSITLQQHKDLEEEKLASFGVHIIWLTDELFDDWWEYLDTSKQPYLTVEITRGPNTHYAIVANPSLPNDIVGNVRKGQCIVTPELYALLGMENTLTKQQREAVVTCCIPPPISDSGKRGLILQPQTQQDLTCFVSSVQEYETIMKSHLEKHRLLYKGQVIYVYPPEISTCIPYKVMELYAQDGSPHQVVSIFNKDVGIDFLPFEI